MTEESPSGRLGFLAQAIDELPEGATGFEAAKAVADFLNASGFVIVPKYRCETCNKSFDSADAKQRHRLDKHMPHRKLSAADRPANLGPVACGYDGCNQSFASEWNATQHRRMAHGDPQ
jgi:hypothetical protein